MENEIEYKVTNLENDVIEIKILIDRKSLAQTMLSKLLAGMQAPPVEKKTRGPNKPKETAPPAAGNIPGQEAFPFGHNVPDGTPIIPPISEKPKSAAIITKPGETREAARQRVGTELATAEKKA